jgi:hypothetical protein
MHAGERPSAHVLVEAEAAERALLVQVLAGLWQEHAKVEGVVRVGVQVEHPNHMQLD